MAHNKKILLDALKNLNNTKSVVKNSNLKEIPEMKKGGKFSSDIGATNRVFKKNALFKKNPLFKSKKKKSKGKTYDPLAPRSAAPMYFDNGGIVELDGYRFKKDASGNWTYESGAPVTDRGMIQRLTYEAKPIGSPVVQSAPKVSLQPRISSQERIQKINDLSKSPRLVDQEQATILAEEQRNVDIYNPEVTPEEKIKPKGLKDLRNLEWNINEKLGFPFERAHTAAAAATQDAGEEADNFRHPLAGRYVAEGIADATGNIPYISPALGFIGANLLGAGHEFMTLVNPGYKDVRSLLTRLSEAGEDVYNNYIGAKVGASDMTPEEKTNYLLYLSYNNKLPDGVVIEKDPKAKGPNNNVYFKKGPKDPGKYKSSYDDGGEYVELELNPEEIEEYKKGGYIVEDISVPSLNQMEEGGAPCPQGYVRVNGKCVPIHNTTHNKIKPYYTSNPNDPRIKAFNDSLDLYSQSTAHHKRLRDSNMIPHIMPNSELNKSQKKAISSAKIKPQYFVKSYRTSKTRSGFKSFSFPAYPSPRQEVIYKPKPKPKKQVTKKVEEKPVIKEQVILEEPMQMMPTLQPTRINSELQKFVEAREPGTGADVMPVYDDTDIEAGTPDPGGHWEDKFSRYIDWDGNSVGFNGIRFRKPGHGGDLIKKGRRHYIHYPSIEKRYDAWIEPDELPEEEFAMGGEYNIGDEVELTDAELRRLKKLGYMFE